MENKGLEALENIKIDMEYVTRLDFVEPVVRGEVQQNLYKIYHRETPELETIEKELKALEILKKYVSIQESNGDLFDYFIVDKQYVSSGSCNVITNKEYDLLKEVLKNE